MKQKMANQKMKKNLILYKGHTGWRVKTRLIGGLVITFSALTFAENAGVVDGQASTTAPDEVNSPTTAPDEVNSPTTTPSQTKAVALRSATPSAPTSSTAPTPDASASSEADNNQAATANAQTKPQAESASLAPDTATQETTAKYPELVTGQQVKVGADTSQVDLTADQIAQHFTATVENRGNNDQDDDKEDNVVKQTIGTDGSISLTSTDPHKYYSSPGNSEDVTGHQAAHVSFEHEIDFSHNFTMKGALGAGDNTADGADSVGFVFAPGDPATASGGSSGGQLGIGTLKNAFGFVFDEYYNGNFNDPSRSPYVGWRTTDEYGNLQPVSSNDDWQDARQLGLNRDATPTNPFTMTYEASTQMLTVILNNHSFSKKIADVSTGYSVSIAASTGGNKDNYSARIDKFSYTPKTIPLTVNIVDNNPKDQGALLNKTNAQAVANIGDTISIFSTQAAADRAVAAGEVTDPSLVAVIPTDSAGNVYVIDGDQVVANNNGKAQQLKEDPSLADATYYTYTVTDQNNQNLTVPVRLAFKAQVTPVDSATQQSIGLAPISVVAVAGEPVLIQIPGYTPTKVVLDTPADGQQVAQDKLLVDQAATAKPGDTPTSTANALGHYYSAQGKTVDGLSVTGAATVGTGQSIAKGLTTGTNTVAGKTDTPTGSDNYYWSDVGNAAATDSTDDNQRQETSSILVPTKATLETYNQEAVDNQTKANTYKTEAQTLFNTFIAYKGLTEAQKVTAQSSLDALLKRYTDVSDSDQAAQDAFGKAEQETAPKAIYDDGQTGYQNLKIAQDYLIQFKADLDELGTTKKQAADSLATLSSQEIAFGQPIAQVEADLGEDFGGGQSGAKITLDAGDTYFVNKVTGEKVTPTDVGVYLINLTDAGRNHLKSLSPDNPNVGLFVSGVLTIDPKDTTATISPVTVAYGETPTVKGDLGQGAGTQDLKTGDFEIRDASQQLVTTPLQVGQTYTVQYTADKQTTLRGSSNYHYTSFGTADLTVTPRDITVTAPQNIGKTYGDPTDPTLELATVSEGSLAYQDQLADLHVGLVRASGENAGAYAITGEQDQSGWNANYAIQVLPGLFTIGKKPIQVTVDSPTITFGDKEPALTFKVEDKGLVDKDTTADLGITLSRVAGQDVGTYTIGVDAGKTSSVSSANYAATITAGKLTITPAAATVVAEPVIMTYGETPTFSASFVDSKGTKTALNLDQTDFKIVGQSVVPGQLQAGQYQVQLTAAAQAQLAKNKDYNYTFNPGTVTVNRKAVTVQATNTKKAYNPAAADPALTFTTQGLVNQDDPTVLKVNLARQDGENAKDYVIGQNGQLKPVTYAQGNYDVKVLPGVFTITRVKATVVVKNTDAIYGDQSITFGTQDPVPGMSTALPQGDFEITDTAGNQIQLKPLQAGSYKIQLTSLAQQQIQLDTNYTYDFVAGTLTVAKRKITVKASPMTVKYGEKMPTPTFTITSGSLVPGDTDTDLKVRVARPTASQVGKYSLNEAPMMRGDLPSKNYDVDFEPGDLEIDPASAGITVVPVPDTDSGTPDLKGTLNVDQSVLPTTAFELVDADGKVVSSDKLPAGQYTLQLSQTTQDGLKEKYPNYTFKLANNLAVSVDKQGNWSTTQKDSDGHVSDVTKHWIDDHSVTTYHFDPDAKTVTVDEQVKGQPDQVKILPLPVKHVIFQDGNNTFTDVNVTDPDDPSITHYRVYPAGPNTDPSKTPHKPATSKGAATPGNLDRHDPLMIDMPGAIAHSGKQLRGHVSRVRVVKAGNSRRVAPGDPQRLRLGHQAAGSQARTIALSAQQAQIAGRRQGHLSATRQTRSDQLETRTVSKTKQTVLPQTGQRDQSFWQFLGLTLLGGLLLPFRRKHLFK